MSQLDVSKWCKLLASMLNFFNTAPKPVLQSEPPPLHTPQNESERVNAIVENRSNQTTPDVYIDEKAQIELMNSENNADVFDPECKI